MHVDDSHSPFKTGNPQSLAKICHCQTRACVQRFRNVAPPVGIAVAVAVAVAIPVAAATAVAAAVAAAAVTRVLFPFNNPSCSIGI